MKTENPEVIIARLRRELEIELDRSTFYRDNWQKVAQKLIAIQAICVR
jgi:hypothetical protein